MTEKMHFEGTAMLFVNGRELSTSNAPSSGAPTTHLHLQFHYQYGPRAGYPSAQPEHHATAACPSVTFVIPPTSVPFGVPGTSWRRDPEVEVFSGASSATDCLFQMTFGPVDGKIGRLFARSLERMTLGTDPAGRGSAPVSSYAASPAA